MTEQVLQCIKIARKAKLDILKTRQQHLKIKTEELRWKWEPCAPGKFFQVLLSPIVYPALIVSIVFNYHTTKAKIRRQINKLESGSPLQPKDRVFSNLWKLHGLDKTYSDIERLKILEQWMAILYPVQQTDFLSKKEEIMAKTQQGSKTSLVDEVKFMIKELDLPDY